MLPALVSPPTFLEIVHQVLTDVILRKYLILSPSNRNLRLKSDPSFGDALERVAAGRAIDPVPALPLGATVWLMQEFRPFTDTGKNVSSALSYSRRQGGGRPSGR